MRLLVFGHNDWWTWQKQGFCGRNAALVRALARRPEVERVAVVDTPRYGNQTHRPKARRAEAVSDVADGIVAVRYGFDLPAPATFHPARVANVWLARPRLARAVCAALPAGSLPVVWVADPQAAATALRFVRNLLVFDAIDDWRYLPGSDVRAVEQGYALMSQRAGLFFAVNRRLLDRLSPRGRGEVLHNAIDRGEWRDAEPDPSVFAGLRRPVAVYLGTLQGRVDVELLLAAAALNPEITHVLAGPRRAGFALDDPPRNVVAMPAVERRDVPGLLLASDACFAAHRREGLVESMDPLKVYEYLAAGKPVVSTTEPPLASLRPHVRVATDAASFAVALREEIAGDNEARRAARRCSVWNETWDARAARVLTLITEARGGAVRGAR